MCRVSHVTCGLRILGELPTHSEWKQKSPKRSTDALTSENSVLPRQPHSAPLPIYQGYARLRAFVRPMLPIWDPPTLPTCTQTRTSPCFLPHLPRVPAQMSPLRIIVIIDPTLKTPLLIFLHTQRFLPRSKRMSNCL